MFSEHPLIHPFSVLNTRSREWIHRKKIWLSYGIKSELGRDTGGAVGGLFKMMNKYDHGGSRNESNNSIFDPVLCELLYSWFSKKGYHIIDPFSGGSVRGIVAGMLGMQYTGIDLNKDQINENNQQLKKIEQLDNSNIKWICGDSLVEYSKFRNADFLFSCPPYFNLEVYSKDKRDLSNMNKNQFINTYSNIIKNCSSKLKNNRFACFVVGNIRNKDGSIFDLVSETIKAFNDSGLQYYNEIILVNTVGSLPIRINKQFSNSRKIGKVHQNILVFVKGCPIKATKIILGEINEEKRPIRRFISGKTRNSK